MAVAVFALQLATTGEASGPERVVLHWESFVAKGGSNGLLNACVTNGRHGTWNNAFDIRRGQCSDGSQGEHEVVLRTVGTCFNCRHNERHVSLAVFPRYQGRDLNGCTRLALNIVQEATARLVATYRLLNVAPTSTSPDAFQISVGRFPQRDTEFLGVTVDDQAAGCPVFTGRQVHQEVEGGVGVYQSCWPDRPNSPNGLELYRIPDVWNYVRFWVHRWKYTEGTIGLTADPQPTCG